MGGGYELCEGGVSFVDDITAEVGGVQRIIGVLPDWSQVYRLAEVRGRERIIGDLTD